MQWDYSPNEKHPLSFGSQKEPSNAFASLATDPAMPSAEGASSIERMTLSPGSPPISDPAPVNFKQALLNEIDKALLLITEAEQILAGRANHG
jgi:hypothetical protein